MKSFFSSLHQTLLRLDLKYITSGGFWLSLGQTASLITVLLLSYIFANYVDAADYGFYKYILSLGAIFAVFSLTGMPQSIMQATARGYTSFFHTGFRLSLLYGLIITTISSTVGLYYFLNGNILIALGCLLIALFKPIINSGQLIFIHFQGLKNFAKSAQLQIVRVTFTTIIIIATIFLTKDILYVLISYFVANAIILIIFYFLHAQKIERSGGNDVAEKKYVSYAKHSSIRNILSGIAFEADKILAFQYLGATQLAIYAFAIAIPEQLKGVFKNLAVLIVIKFTGYSMDSIKENMYRKELLLGIVLILLAIVYIVSAPFIYKLLFPLYEDSILISQIFALSFPAMVAIFPISALQAQMREKELHILNYSMAVFLIISVFIGISQFGLIGLVVAKVLTRYTHATFAFVLLYKN